MSRNVGDNVPQTLPLREVNRHYVVIAALKSLADEGLVPQAKVAEAILLFSGNRRELPAHPGVERQPG